MIHYHGGPITPLPVGLAVWKARHAMVSFANADQIRLAAEICQSFAIDNGAYTTWTLGKRFDMNAYAAFIEEWMWHPGFDWCLIPDVIDGDEAANDSLLDSFDIGCRSRAVPVWHMHESMERLARLVAGWPRVALGSSGDYAEIGTLRWWGRMHDAMATACDSDGRPKAKLHGLRMMDPTVFSHIPFASVDSTAVARNSGLDVKWRGPYQPLTEEARAMVLVDRIEAHASAARWNRRTSGVQKNFELVG